MKLTYRRCGDYYLPNIGIPAEDMRPLGNYGRMRMRYLREHRSLLFNQLLLSGKLMKHLYSIDDACQKHMDLLIPQMKAAEGVTEELKAIDQMEWVRRMNSIHNRIEEMLFNELIYDWGTVLQKKQARAPVPVSPRIRSSLEVHMKKLLKLPLRIASLPIIALVLVFQLISSLIWGLTSVVINLLATVFLIGSVAGWIANAPGDLIFQTVSIGISFAFAPRIAGWLLGKATDLPLGLLDFLLAWCQDFLLALFRHSAEQNRESAR